jgi:hypothetical protein
MYVERHDSGPVAGHTYAWRKLGRYLFLYYGELFP